MGKSSESQGIKRFVVAFFDLLIQGYQWFLSPLLSLLFPGLGCRFHPTCSQYARECFVLHGPWKGIYLALRRIGRCHPFHKGGIDSPPTMR